MTPFSKEGEELLFQVLAERNDKGSVIITTNLGLPTALRFSAIRP
ncbi:ATP-binding protein [Syntrophus buswellii]